MQDEDFKFTYQGYLLDSSTLVAAMLEKDDSALQVFRDPQPKHIIDLTLLEVSNALKFKGVALNTIKEIIKAIKMNATLLEWTEQDLHFALRICADNTSTVYDCIHHVVALRHDLRFVTKDKKYRESNKFYTDILLLN